jgi:hypothetical protein
VPGEQNRPNLAVIAMEVENRITVKFRTGRNHVGKTLIRSPNNQWVKAIQLKTALPALATELHYLLEAAGENELALQVDSR